ncbi:MAG TPA: hypothetical protein VGH40_18660 [Roseiarcus sp.]
MRNFSFLATALPILVGLALWANGNDAALAAEGHSFIVAGNDGYGIEDCLAEGSECGQVVADAWCEAHGHGAAISFGRAADVTGSIRLVGPAPTDSPYFVTCGD